LVVGLLPSNILPEEIDWFSVGCLFEEVYKTGANTCWIRQVFYICNLFCLCLFIFL